MRVGILIAPSARMATIHAAGGMMSVIYGLIPGMIILGLVSVLVFFWAVKNGQYDDMEGPAHRILDDDDLETQIPEAGEQRDAVPPGDGVKHD